MVCTIFAGMKRYALFLFFIVCVFIGYAQRAEVYFATMPQSVLPILDKTARLDMIDLYNSNMVAKAENVYGGQAEMLKKTDDFIKIRCTESSSWQMKVLPLGHDTLIVCIHSVQAVDTSSKVKVYKRDWYSVKRDIPVPSRNHFFRTNVNMTQERRQQLVTEMCNLPIEMTWSDSEPLLTFTLSKKSLPMCDQEDAEALVRSVTYKWISGKWVQQQ